MELFGFILDAGGKIMVAYTAIRVHYRFLKEHQVDDKVFNEMKFEQGVGIVGIALILVGSALQIPLFL